MNIGNIYRRARNALCFEKKKKKKKKKKHFTVTVQLDNIKAKKSSKKSKYKSQPIPLKFWHRILVPDFPSWSRQIQIDLPHYLRTRQTSSKMFISGLV